LFSDDRFRKCCISVERIRLDVGKKHIFRGEWRRSATPLAVSLLRRQQLVVVRREEDSLRKLRIIAVIGGIVVLMSCASQPKPAPQDDPRIGQLQSQVDDLQKQLASRDAEMDALKKSDAEKQTALEIAAQKDQKDLDARIAELNKLFAAEIARGDLDIRRFRDVLIVSVKDFVFFAPDSPNLRPESLNLLKQLAEVFKSAPDRIVRVEGNTAVAISSPETLRLYPTSWHLGAARAANVVQYLQDKCGMNPLQLVATSLGQYRPRADNSTEQGQEKNRRVDFILVARSLYEIDQLKTVAQ